MPRQARERSQSGIYHIMLRGINKQTIFEDNQDRHRFLHTVKKYKGISEYNVYSYCLMDNHVHLLLKEGSEGISNAIKRISSSYVYWYNTKYDRYGHLFQGRYRSENVESAVYFLKVLRYIHQNPLKAGLAEDVFQSKWTSVHEYLGQADLVDIDFGLQLLSENRDKAIRQYKEYMQQMNNDQCLEVNEKKRKKDSEVRDYLFQLGIGHVSILQQMDKRERNAVLAKLKMLQGVSLRQLSRVTGISKSVIQRAKT